ncbi:hypothetical protein ACFL0W_05180 [Nanoarchaeota archaeon]
MKKAQVKATENMLILFFFFILLGLGFIFFAGLQKTKFEQRGQEAFELDVIKVAQRMSFFPEIQCSVNNIIQPDNCVDYYKASSLSGQFADINNKIFYFNDFGNSRIVINQTFPKSAQWGFVLYDRKPANISELRNIQVPVSIFNASKPYNKAFTFGVITVGVYR